MVLIIRNNSLLYPVFFSLEKKWYINSYQRPSVARQSVPFFVVVSPPTRVAVAASYFAGT